MGYFGIPFRNGVPIGLGSVVSFGAQQFDPSELFVGGTAGAWYDPSDLSTMFTTSAGTTPVAMPGGGAAVSVGRMLDKSGNGNHAIAFNNTTARPELRARVNLLEYSEQFDNGVWQTTNLGSASPIKTANQGIAPDGTNTADRIDFGAITNATDYSRLFQSFTSVATTYVGSVYLKAFSASDVGKKIFVWLFDSAGRDTQTVTLTDSWQRISSTSALTAGTSFITLQTAGSSVVTGGGAQAATSALVWGADLRPANIGANVPAYQRIAGANTYDTSGFPLYLFFDGIDDSMYTPANLNLSGTDKVAVFAGVRKLSDAAAGILAELSASTAANNGAFLFGAPDSATPSYVFVSKGTISSSAQILSGFAAPITNVVSGAGDISGDSAILRVNGTQQASSSSDQGTGNFGTYPLFIGARNNSSLWFNGHLHSLIIAGSAVSAGNISATEQWVAGKTGITI